MKKLNLICFLLTILFLSCNKTEINNINDNILKDGKVIIPININVEDPNIISTKALNEQESKISNIYVALFTATSDNDFDGNNTLLEIVKKNINDPSPIVILNQQSNPCRIYTLVNVSGDNINRIEALPKGTKLSDFLKLSSVINDIKLENTNFPMYGESIFLKEGINKNTVLNIKAKKTFSKITINVNSLDFIIHELMIINSVTNGYLTGNNNSFSETANSEVSVANHTNSNIIKQLSLYSYPNKTNTPTDILIKGAYQGKEPTYYKVRLRYKNNASDTDYKVNINDNTNYIININSVKHNGYDYKGDAINNEPSNIIYDVTVLDNESHEIIINNGDYYLGLSNSELIIYGAGSIITF